MALYSYLPEIKWWRQYCSKKVQCLEQSLQRQPALGPRTDPGGVCTPMLAQQRPHRQELPSPLLWYLAENAALPRFSPIVSWLGHFLRERETQFPGFSAAKGV